MIQSRASIKARMRRSLWTFIHSAVALLERGALGLGAPLRCSGSRHILPDGTPAKCHRADAGRADYSGKPHPGVNPQVTTAPDGTPVWTSPAAPGRVHDLPPAGRHRITATCIRLGIPRPAGKAYQGAADTVAVPQPRKPEKGLTAKKKSVNQAHSRLRWPVQRAIAQIKTWHTPSKARINPNELTSITKAILTLETLR